jgi:hypothetical protein
LSIHNPKKVTPTEYLRGLANDGTPVYRKELAALGFDGIRISTDPGLDDLWADEVWVAFHPTQIKSATGNCGAFSPTDPNICR